MKTDSKTIAQQKLERVWRCYLNGWKAKLADRDRDRDGDAEARFRAARNLAATKG